MTTNGNNLERQLGQEVMRIYDLPEVKNVFAWMQRATPVYYEETTHTLFKRGWEQKQENRSTVQGHDEHDRPLWDVAYSGRYRFGEKGDDPSISPSYHRSKVTLNKIGLL
ncbi:MAG: hypothetical protein M5U34_37930 [Chloroflexi bacterium]|nr:hypothetical protein [Chloroflexota bacterium]